MSRMENDPSRRPEIRPASRDAIKDLCSVLKTLSKRLPKTADMNASARVFSLQAAAFEKQEKHLGRSVYAAYVLENDPEKDESGGIDDRLIISFNLNPDKTSGIIGRLIIGCSELVGDSIEPVLLEHEIHVDKVFKHKKVKEDHVPDEYTEADSKKIIAQEVARYEEDSLGLSVMSEDEVIDLAERLKGYTNVDDPDQWNFDN